MAAAPSTPSRCGKRGQQVRGGGWSAVPAVPGPARGTSSAAAASASPAPADRGVARRARARSARPASRSRYVLRQVGVSLQQRQAHTEGHGIQPLRDPVVRPGPLHEPISPLREVSPSCLQGSADVLRDPVGWERRAPELANPIPHRTVQAARPSAQASDVVVQQHQIVPERASPAVQRRLERFQRNLAEVGA